MLKIAGSDDVEVALVELVCDHLKSVGFNRVPSKSFRGGSSPCFAVVYYNDAGDGFEFFDYDYDYGVECWGCDVRLEFYGSYMSYVEYDSDTCGNYFKAKFNYNDPEFLSSLGKCVVSRIRDRISSFLGFCAFIILIFGFIVFLIKIS